VSRPAERRGSRRRTAKPLRAQLALEAQILCLSSRGMMVRLPFAPELRSHHEFSLRVSGRSLDLEGVVRNVTPKDDETDAFDVGIEFVRLAAAQEHLLEQFVAKKLKTTR
jgi:hypothetical protein